MLNTYRHRSQDTTHYGTGSWQTAQSNLSFSSKAVSHLPFQTCSSVPLLPFASLSSFLLPPQKLCFARWECLFALLIAGCDRSLCISENVSCPRVSQKWTHDKTSSRQDIQATRLRGDLTPEFLCMSLQIAHERLESHSWHCNWLQGNLHKLMWEPVHRWLR